MINWIKKHWPLVWAKTLREYRELIATIHERWEDSNKHFRERITDLTAQKDKLWVRVSELEDKTQDAVDKAIVLERERDTAEAKALGFQRRFAELVPRDQRISPTVVPNRHWVMVTTDPETKVMRVEDRRLQYVGASVAVDLGSDTPPEYVAEQLAASIRDAVLKEYQKQSILGSS